MATDGAGDLPGPAARLRRFLIDMPTLFEDFVTLTLREAIWRTYGGGSAARTGAISTKRAT